MGHVLPALDLPSEVPGPQDLAPVARPVPRRPAAWYLRLVSPLVVLAVWQAASASGWLSPDKLSAPVQVARQARDLIVSGELPSALTVSVRRALLGFLIGSAVAVVLAVLAASSRWGDLAVDPLLQMVRTVPLFGLVPLFVLWFGIGEAPKVLLVSLGALVPLYLNLHSALHAVDPDLLEVARTLRLTRRERLQHVLLPSAMPGLLVGVRQALGFSWLALVVAEQVNADAGLGFLVNNARQFLLTDTVVVGLLTYALLGLLTDAGVRLLEARALRWRGQAA
jgi:sulfonate transport system permease protein